MGSSVERSYALQLIKDAIRDLGYAKEAIDEDDFNLALVRLDEVTDGIEEAKQNVGLLEDGAEEPEDDDEEDDDEEDEDE